MVAPRVFFDFAYNNEPLGRVIFELYNVSAPKASENFRALCTGEKGISAVSQLPLYYKNSIMHRVIPDFMIQGGDFTKRNGTGGESIYGGLFADEDLSRPVDEAGLLVMANRGPNTNSSQFFITLRSCPHLNGKHVVFGRVIRGFDEVAKRIAEVPTDEKDRPTTPVIIANCGELELRQPPPKLSSRKALSSEGASESDDGRGRKSRRRARSNSSARSASRSVSRSLSRSSDASDSEEERRRRKELKKEKKREKKEQRKAKKRKHRSRSPEASKVDGVVGVTRQETEEEYDARLEREENERIEAARLRKIAEMKTRYAEREESKGQGPVRYKGRGRMKYIDPESRSRYA